SKAQVTEKAREMMELVGLAKRLENAYPHELDGGRRQRIGIARALSLNPEFIVCDEPVSALDVSIQAQVLNLLQDLQEQRGLTYMFITHDMSVVKHISDDIAVMYLGQMIEKCSADRIFRDTIHPYSQALLSAIPIPNVHVKHERMVLKGELTSPIDPKPCCRFAQRCPYATDKCLAEEPKLREILPNHHVACHFAEKFVK
ncbi:MAG: ABC transporter ATP-binding protein, partial [Lachnospiraceae bacterium]|nr:ABC transporter ATP-binding protein [Lachnospiraceae bacterium]